jgi:hypothetical protein
MPWLKGRKSDFIPLQKFTQAQSRLDEFFWGIKKPQAALVVFDFHLAEKEGFEPPLAFTKTVFKTAAFNRSAISP